MDRHVTFLAKTDRPADEARGMLATDHSQRQPTLARSNIVDVTRRDSPFLTWRSCHEVAIQQMGCDVEPVVAVRGTRLFTGPTNGYAVLAH